MAKNRQQPPKSILRLKVQGPHIRPGRVPIPELIEICRHSQSAIHRQAEALVGRRSLRPGPITASVLEKCTLELFSVGKGSAVMSFAEPEPGPGPQTINMLDLPEMDVTTLGEQAVISVVQSINAIRRGSFEHVELGVMKSLQELAPIVADGVQSIEWVIPRDAGRKRTVAVFDQAVKERIEAVPSEPTFKPVDIHGVLEMADFKASDLKCIVHTADDRRIPCTFTEDLADDVYKGLRHATRITGVAAIHPQTKRPEEIELRSVTVLDPHLIETETFFAGQTLQDLANAQGVKAGAKIASIQEDESDEDIDAFLAGIYSLRS